MWREVTDQRTEHKNRVRPEGRTLKKSTCDKVSREFLDGNLLFFFVRDMIEEQTGTVWSQIFHQQFHENIKQHRRN